LRVGAVREDAAAGAVAGTEYVYDGNGNTVAKLPYTLADAGNNSPSISLVLAGEICELFTYDGMNRLVEAEVNGVVAQ